MEKAERQKDTGLLPLYLTVHGDADPPPLTSLPRTNTRVLLVRKKTEQLWPTARFLLFCPNYCVASCAEIGFSGFRA